MSGDEAMFCRCYAVETSLFQTSEMQTPHLNTCKKYTHLSKDEACSFNWFIIATPLLAIPDVDPSLVGILDDLEEEVGEGAEGGDAGDEG